MRQQRTYSIIQAYIYMPSKHILQKSQTHLAPGRVDKCVSFVLGLALGTGMAVMLSLLSTGFFPLTPATATSVRPHAQAQVWTLSPSAVEEPGLSSAFMDPFVRP